MRIFFFTLTLFLPLYGMRLPLELYGREIGFPVVEIAAWLFACAVFVQGRVGVVELAKQFLFTTQIFLINLRRPTPSSIFYLLSSHLLATSLCVLFLGLFLGVLQSNDPLLSLGIIRGWFAAPIALFLALCIWRDFPQYQKGAVGALAMSGAGAAAASFFWPNGFNGDGRLQGFYGSPNYLAMYVAPLLPLALYQWRLATTPKVLVWWQASQGPWRYVWLACVTVMAWAIFFSYSHGAWLGFVAGALFLSYVFLRTKIVLVAARAKERAVTKGFVISLLFLTRFVHSIKKLLGYDYPGSFLLPLNAPSIRIQPPYSIFYFLFSILYLFFAAWGAWQVLGGALTNELQSRLGLWQAAVNMGADNPLFGIGAGMFSEVYQLQKHIIEYPVPLEVALHPHNIFLTFWLYGGALGLAGFLGILWWLFIKFRPLFLVSLGSSDDPRRGNMLHAVLAAAFIIILIHGLVDTTYWKNDLAFVWWVLIALAHTKNPP